MRSSILVYSPDIGKVSLRADTMPIISLTNIWFVAIQLCGIPAFSSVFVDP